MASCFVCLLRIHLHFPENGSLKGKRKELNSLKAQLQRRFGAAVSETDHHDLWQRATLSAALVGRDPGRWPTRAPSSSASCFPASRTASGLRGESPPPMNF